MSISVFRDFIFKKFLSCSFDDFSANLDPNLVIFDSVDSSFQKLSKSLILIHISLSDLIEFQMIIQNYINSTCIRPSSTTILLNS